jgi:hypothetical protein
MSQNSNDVPRKPSGTSSLSGAHSPLGSPGNVRRCIVSEVALFISYMSFPHPGSIPAESCTAYSKQYVWGRRGHAWHTGKLEPWLRLAGPCGSLTPSLSIHRNQVWGGVAPSPQRNVSASSAPASIDPLSNQPETPFRSNMAEGWRAGNGAWADDDAGDFSLVSLQKSGTVPGMTPHMSTFDEPLKPLHQGRPRQVSVAHSVTFSPHTVSH